LAYIQTHGHIYGIWPWPYIWKYGIWPGHIYGKHIAIYMVYGHMVYGRELLKKAHGHIYGIWPCAFLRSSPLNRRRDSVAEKLIIYLQVCTYVHACIYTHIYTQGCVYIYIVI